MLAPRAPPPGLTGLAPLWPPWPPWPPRSGPRGGAKGLAAKGLGGLGLVAVAKAYRAYRIAKAVKRRSFTNDDVVVVYDRNSKNAGEVVVAVEQDSAMAPRKVDYAVLPSSDATGLSELARQRGLNEEDMKRLTREASATAVLPSGAMIQDLEMDPWPLLRELRYRTCLEYNAEEQSDLEDRYFGPLRSMRHWWKQPRASELLARQLHEVGFVVIDDFLPEDLARSVKASNLQLYQQSDMQEGATTGGSERVGIPHRGDVLKWVGYDGETEASSCVQRFTGQIEEALQCIAAAATDAAPTVASAMSNLRWRSETMLTCYPAAKRARYFRHTDNSSGNGRLLTALVYLNEDWQKGDGGELRLFHPGEKNLKVRMEVEPLWNRLLLFWSDDRSPHEVLSACKDRFAATVWYYDQHNPSIPLTELGVKPEATAAPEESPEESAEESLEELPEELPEELAEESREVGEELLLFYDGDDPEVVALAEGMDSEQVAKHVDLRSDGAEAALMQAGTAEWAGMEYGMEADEVIAELGKLFLCLPGGELLKHGETEQWMLEYELNYWRLVKPPSEVTRRRLQETLFGPLEKLRSSFKSRDGLWWASPDAVSVWGQALARESFAVLDDFLPAADAEALARAVRRMTPEMSPGKTDSGLSASGRTDTVLWVPPDSVAEMGRLVEFSNAMVTLLMELPQETLKARTSQITALSDAQLTRFGPENTRYIRHVDNEDGKNGRLITCTFYLNEDWTEEDGGEIRLFEPDQQRIKADVAPKMNRLAIFFSDSSVPYEVRRCHRERYAITTWYINQELHLQYHQAEEEGQ